MTSITCRELLDFLSDYLEGTLPADTSADFAGHLSVCPECVAYLDNFRATMRASRAAFAPANEPLPEELVQAILQAMKAEPTAGESAGK